MLIYERVEVCAKPSGVNSRRIPGRCLDHAARNKPASGHRSEFRYRSPVAGDGQMPTCLYLPQDGPGIVAKLALSDRTHGRIVATVASCSTLMIATHATPCRNRQAKARAETTGRT